MNTDPNQVYVAFQAWLVFLWSLTAVKMFAGAAILWVIAQALDKKWASGLLFERKWAWVTTSIAALFLFTLFVVPYVTKELLLGIVAVGILIALALYQRAKWK